MNEVVDQGGGREGSVVSAAVQWGAELLEMSRSVSRNLTKVGVVFGLSGVVLWTAPALPFDISAAGVGGWLWRGLLLVVLLVPSVVSVLFASGLAQLAALPPQLFEKTVGGKDEALLAVKGSLAGGRTKNLINVVRGLWRVGRSSIELKDTVLGGVALVKLFNPIVLVVVVVSVLFGFGFTIAAAVRAVWWIVT